MGRPQNRRKAQVVPYCSECGCAFPGQKENGSVPVWSNLPRTCPGAIIPGIFGTELTRYRVTPLGLTHRRRGRVENAASPPTCIAPLSGSRTIRKDTRPLCGYICNSTQRNRVAIRECLSDAGRRAAQIDSPG